LGVSLCVFGAPEIDLVLDTLGAGAVLKFLEYEVHGEGLTVDVGVIEDDQGEAEVVRGPLVWLRGRTCAASHPRRSRLVILL
jgi:hypothetical protein